MTTPTSLDEIYRYIIEVNLAGTPPDDITLGVLLLAMGAAIEGGVTGPQGFQGAQGPQGFQGTQGVQGSQGNQGTQGVQGVQGATGSGAQGAQGTQGAQGGAGAQGAQGTQGFQGSQGTQGHQGFQGASGGGGSFPDFTGNGSPEGVQIANAGQWYEDKAGTSGGLYVYAGTSGSNTGWLQVGGFGTTGDTPGFAGTVVLLADPNTYPQAIISDTLGINGTGNGVYWEAYGADGTQQFVIRIGPSGFTPFNWTFNPDGSTQFPGDMGFFGTTPIAKPTVTGSKGGNAALASLMTALADYGLVTDSTT